MIFYFYSFEPATGNLSWCTDAVRGLSESFTYDDDDNGLHSRLTSWSINGQNQAELQYQPNGNISRKTDVSPSLDSYNYQHPQGKPHAVTSVSQPTPAFVSAAPEQSIIYTPFNKLSSISNTYPSGRNYDLGITYGPDNQRKYSRLIADEGVGMPMITETYFLGQYETKRQLPSTEQKIHYLNGPTGLFGILVGDSEQLYYVLKDHLGSITGITDVSGNILEDLSYDPWGRRRNANDWTDYNVSPTRFDRGYTGHEHLSQFGLINMNGRVYDPFLARFLSPDPQLQSPEYSQNYNRYSYAWNNPLKYTDPSGEFVFTALALIIPGAQFLLPFAIAADVGSIVNVASNWSSIDNFGEGLGYYGVGATSGAISQVPGFGIPLSGFIIGAGNEFLNTNILTDDVSWSDLDENVVGRILLAGGIGAASSHYGAKWGGQFADKAIEGLNVESIFLKNAIEKTFQGFTGGYINGFFSEVMIDGGNVKSAINKGFVQGGWGAAFGFTFSSVEYGLNRSGVEQYWTRKELSLKIRSPYDDYYEYNFKYEKGSQPNTPYYKYNPRTTPSNTPGNNWRPPMKAPTPSSSPFNLYKTIYPELYYPWRR
ncbi:MAG: RHS repeat-associated core domain-containing protein [Bacteroidales bacterium]|nr:RHS repeat-associated core domain-containing protein [Bacteroidales bacterium]